MKRHGVWLGWRRWPRSRCERLVCRSLVSIATYVIESLRMVRHAWSTWPSSSPVSWALSPWWSLAWVWLFDEESWVMMFDYGWSVDMAIGGLEVHVITVICAIIIMLGWSTMIYWLADLDDLLHNVESGCVSSCLNRNRNGHCRSHLNQWSPGPSSSENDCSLTVNTYYH
jgi:hypothetical protein